LKAQAGLDEPQPPPPGDWQEVAARQLCSLDKQLHPWLVQRQLGERAAKFRPSIYFDREDCVQLAVEKERFGQSM
jgi:hypothetical protein